MENANSSMVKFANLNFEFTNFQRKHKELCENIADVEREGVENKSKYKKNLKHKLKILRGFIYEYLCYSSVEFRNDINKRINDLKIEIYDDSTYDKLLKLSNNERTTEQKVLFYQKYYSYIIKIYEIIGFYSDELTKTFMPNKSDREKLFKYSNSNSFFEQFSYYKTNIGKSLGDFSIYEPDVTITHMISFYYAYYLFIDEKSKLLCEGIFEKLINIILSKDILINISRGKKNISKNNIKLMNEIEYIVHDSLLKIFFRMNYSYSEFGIMPKKEKVIRVDRTTI